LTREIEREKTETERQIGRERVRDGVRKSEREGEGWGRTGGEKGKHRESEIVYCCFFACFCFVKQQINETPECSANTAKTAEQEQL
jgi:hypothetical protein